MTRQRKWQIKRKEEGLCIKCSKPAVVFSSGKRAGQASVFCASHLDELRERNRAKALLRKQLASLKTGEPRNKSVSGLAQDNNKPDTKLKWFPAIAAL